MRHLARLAALLVAFATLAAAQKSLIHSGMPGTGPAALAAGRVPLPPACIPKFSDPLVVPPPMPAATAPRGSKFAEYSVSARRITQRVLPTAAPLAPAGVTCPTTFGNTPVLAYGATGAPGTFNWPAFTIEAKRGLPARVTWVNEIVDANGNFATHPLDYAIDQTLHWANPGRLGGTTDDSPCHACLLQAPGACASDPACVTAANTTYSGPVPMVTHLHGADGVADHSDGYTEAWFLPDARNLRGPNPGYATSGTWYNTFARAYTTSQPGTWARGSSTSVYTNAQRSAALWYHDHALGVTRLNVYAGLAGFYLLRAQGTGPELPGLPYPPPDGVLPQRKLRELPLAIQDRAFTLDSELYYPPAELAAGEALPTGVQSPTWIPELFWGGAAATNPFVLTVNGRTFPRVDVLRDTYRLRVLNGCNARVLQLKFALSAAPELADPNDPTLQLLPFWVIGNEAGFYPAIQGPVTALQVGQAERFDVVVDFTAVPSGQHVFIINTGPEGPYDGTNNGVPPTTQFTGQALRFDFVAFEAGDAPPQPFDAPRRAMLNAALAAQAPAPLPPPTAGRAPRQLALLEQNNPVSPNLVQAIYLGVATSNPVGALNSARATPWTAPVATNSPVGVIEEWDIINLTPDAHPIHLHESQFQVVGSWAVQQPDPNNTTAFINTNDAVTNADIDPWLSVNCTVAGQPAKCPAYRDVVQVLPATRTRLRLRASAAPGLFVWHCHLVEHEDNEMMVPWCIGQPGYVNPKTGTPMCPGPN